MISLSEAADAANISKSTMLRAIKKGRISAGRNENDAFMIDPSEFLRVWPDAALRAAVKRNAASHKQSDAAPDAVVYELRAMLDAERRIVEELRSDRDAWREQAQRLSLTVDRPRRGGLFARFLRGAA